MTRKRATPVLEGERLEPGKVKRLTVKNFRCIGTTPVTIDLDNIVVLVGPNNAGKSSILRAYELIMLDGSKKSNLAKEDFPNGEPDEKNLPTMELWTEVNDPPASKWVSLEDGKKIVRERWIWDVNGESKRSGWNTELNDWDETSFPWGPANIANTRRPQPHRVEAFDSPEKQADEITKLIVAMVEDRAKQILSPDGSGETEYAQIYRMLADFQKKAFDQTKSDVEAIESRLTEMIANIFTDHFISFSLNPFAEKGIQIFSGSTLSVGKKDGWQGPLRNQGSGARRAIMWAVLRVHSEQSAKSSSRPRVLLIDEPELCLHPDAIREACQVLYDLADKAGWQVIVTTHSPAFIDLSRDNTTVVRVERSASGNIKGTTLYKPEKIKLDPDDRTNLHLLNVYDPYVAEFFFGGDIIVVEGDTEYSAFKHVQSEANAGRIPGASPIKNLQIIRARGKSTIISVCKILNQFGTPYSILHDTDTPEIKLKTGQKRVNSAWTANNKILQAVNNAPEPDKIRLIASLKNFESAFLGRRTKRDKPYQAIQELKNDMGKLKTIYELLIALVDHQKPIPPGAINLKITSDDDLKEAVGQY